MKAVIAMYAYFFTSNGRRVRVWQESVRGMPLLRLEAPVKLNQRRCRRIRHWLKRCGVHQLLNRPAHWPESEPLPPLIGTRELWITKAPETALALLAQAGISPAQARVEFCSDRFTPELADTAMALATTVRALSFSCPVSEAFCWQLQRDHGLCPGFGSGNADLSICFSPAQRTFALPLWQMRPEISRFRLTSPRLRCPAGCPEEPLLAALWAQGRIGTKEIRIQADFS